MSTMKSIAATAAAALVLASVAPRAALAAGGATSPEQFVLRYRSADLATPAALERTYQRMSRAAELVCLPHASRELSRQRVYQRCVAGTLGAAVVAVHDPRLSALHDDNMRIIAPVASSPLRTAHR